MREPESHNGKYSKEGLELELEVKADEVLVVKQKGAPLATVPAKSFKACLEKSLNREVAAEELPDLLRQYSPILDIEASFTVYEGSPYEYGADADGNRGEMRTDIEDLEDDNLEIEKLELRLVDENGDVLGGEDNFLDLGDYLQSKNDPLIDYILDDINSDMNSYI